MSKDDEDKARVVFRASLVKARDEILNLLAGDPLPREMHEDVMDILEHIEAILESSETPDERDAAVDEVVEAIRE